MAFDPGLLDAFQRDMAASSNWVPVWVNFMSLVILLAVPFAFTRTEARWTLLAMAFTFPSMMALYAEVGYVRLLGIVHVIFWTPLLIYLLRRRHNWRVRDTLSGKWILLLTATITASLVMDYADVARYIASERG